VIAATNVPPATLKDPDVFRQDLLFRLNTVEIAVPPLRERIDDILPIANHYAELFARKYRQDVRAFSPSARAAMVNDPWPGNVRALRHAIERAVILSSGEYIEPADLQLSDAAPAAAESARQPEPPPPSAHAEPPPARSLDEIEKQAVLAVLKKHGFNISHAARELGLTRASLYRRMEKHGI